MLLKKVRELVAAYANDTISQLFKKNPRKVSKPYVRRSSPATVIDRERWQDKESLEILLQKINAAAIPASMAPVRTAHLLRKWGRAAAVIFLLGAGTVFWQLYHQPIPASLVKQAATIQAGKEVAVLTLANGSQVQLDTVSNKVIALQGGATAKVVHGALVYEGSGKETI